jgi:hypothetical protein
VFPESTLPHATFTPRATTGGDSGIWISIDLLDVPYGELALDTFPARREVRIAAGKTSDTVKMLRQDNHRDSPKRSIPANQANGLPQDRHGSLALEDPPTVERNHHEEVCLAWDHPATIVRHSISA